MIRRKFYTLLAHFGFWGGEWCGRATALSSLRSHEAMRRLYQKLQRMRDAGCSETEIAASYGITPPELRWLRVTLRKNL